MSEKPRDVMSVEENLHEIETMLGNHGPQPQVRRSWSMPFASAVPKSILDDKEKKVPKTELHRTAYLDGLRGFAALLVFSLHHQVWGHSGTGGEFILENAFGWNGVYQLICFPGIRILFSGGHLAVAIFFVISGYVLSVKPLTLLQSGDMMKMSENLASALFRRWLRLYIPVAGTTFAWMTSWHLLNIRSGNPIAEMPESTYLSEIWKWYCNFKNYSFVFDGEPTNIYNDHTCCVARAIKKTNCAPNDSNCICRSEHYLGYLQYCFIKKCNAADKDDALQIATNICDIVLETPAEEDASDASLKIQARNLPKIPKKVPKKNEPPAKGHNPPPPPPPPPSPITWFTPTPTQTVIP
ncbi:hypothetical protein KCU78_g1876, partial [Aureobasidium melanogenum]